MKKRVLSSFISLITGFVSVLSLFYYFHDSFKGTDSRTSLISVHAAGESDNPFDKQDDTEVPYDGKRWIQPKEWNVPTINPKDYEGGIMLYCDKIGLEPEYARGKVQRVYFSITDADEPVSYVKFHIFYDTRLKIRENSAGKVITTGKGLKSFTTGSAMIEEGKLAFYAYSSEDTLIDKSCLFTIDFVVPENAEQGELYPIGIAYEDDGIVADTFINSRKDEAGKLQMTYLFTKGIYNGYIKILGEKKTTTTVTSAVTSTTVKPVPTPGYSTGDANGDGKIDANDATLVLVNYSLLSTGEKMQLTESQQKAADVNGDGKIDASDATMILQYYSYLSTGGDLVFKEFMKQNG